jgi:antibiotic biosynthesis monooxygenase (ABM) superfamily enzyme
MAIYESEITAFLRGLREQSPELPERQRAGRALWWDCPADPEELARWKEARVRQGAYVYYGMPARKD